MSDVMDYHGKPEWPPARSAELFSLTVPHVEAAAAARYIEEHEAELRPEYEKMLARDHDYAERVAARMMGRPAEIDRLRGSGRLYLP